jgi:hypothetical protein
MTAPILKVLRQPPRSRGKTVPWLCVADKDGNLADGSRVGQLSQSGDL